MNTLSTSPAVLAASTVTTIGATLVVLLILGLLAYVWVNLRQGRAEVGAELELAPNRKPYYDDDQLETTVLNRTLRWALVLLVITAVGLPLYWLNEPGRMSGAIDNFEETFVNRGEELYVEGSGCQDCHGPEGTGGQAATTLLDDEGEFVAAVNWRAPALDTVLLRFSREEVEYIINFGRPFSPMAGWGAAVNKGPLTEQQVSNIIDYLDSIQLSSEEAQQQVADSVAGELGVDADDLDYGDPAVGEALFNNEVAGGAYACARCHTRGWSVITTGEDAVEPPDAPIDGVFVGFPDGSGAFGPNITGGLVPKKFATFDQLVDFLSLGSEDGELYGTTGIGSGRMPGFGDNPNTEEVEADGMMTREQIEAIARYVNGLPAAETPDPAGAPSADQLGDVESDDAGAGAEEEEG
jgi:mono/diheme cytochrome c family protein